MLISLLSWPPRRRPNTTGSGSRLSASAPNTDPAFFLSNSQWLLIADLFPDPQVGPNGGRPPVPSRPCLEGILWVLITGARWKALLSVKEGPERYPSPCTCWRRHRDWTASGAFRAAWDRLLGTLLQRRGIDWHTAIGDGSFIRAKRGVTTRDVAIVETAPASCC